MTEETLKYKSNIAMRNYGFVFGLMLLAFVLLKFGGDSWELILLKLSVVPLGFLSWKGIVSLYRWPIIEYKLTLRAFEYSVLQAIVMAVLCFVMIWQPGLSTIELVKYFGSFLLLFVVVQLLFMLVKVRRLSKDTGSKGA